MLHCGRRWGKTKWGANEAIRVTVNSPPGSVGVVVAPSYGSSSLGKCWGTILEDLPRQLISEIHRTPGSQYIRLKGNRTIHFRSAENPEACKGEGYAWAWLDEPAGMGQEIWEYAILPALADKHGKAWFTGTPKGRNWYYLLCMKGYDPLNADFKSWCYPSTNNTIEKGGVIHAEDLEAIARNMSERAQRQELGGEFLSDVGAVFVGFKGHIKGTQMPLEGVPDSHYERPDENMRYRAGADLGKYQDYTVLIILDFYGHVCVFDRRQIGNWHLQREWLADTVKRYHASLLLDSTGLGDPILDEMRHEGVQVEGYVMSQPKKEDLIENLVITLENDKASFPDIPILLTELDLYGYVTMPAGNRKYSAPEGFHDDCVVAFALAVWHLNKSGGPPDAWRLG